MTDTLIAGEITKLDVRPGDVVLVRLNKGLRPDRVADLRYAVSRALPEGVKALVLVKDDADVSVLRHEEIA